MDDALPDGRVKHAVALAVINTKFFESVFRSEAERWDSGV
jgi:hypothetical protein